jgi:hypothetical protein
MAEQEPDGYWTALGAWSEAVDALWATRAVPSPGGWSVPKTPEWWGDTSVPGDEPPLGMVERLDRMPWWVRVWYHTPFLDRRASAWMWSHGGFDVLPPSVTLPPPPEPPQASVVLPLSGQSIELGDPAWGLADALGATRITDRRRRFFSQRWAWHVYGVRPTPAPVSVRFCRSSRWRFLRRSGQAEVVYGAQGLWAAETVGRWDVAEVSHAGQTHRRDIPSRRGGRPPRPPKARRGTATFGPGTPGR